MARGWSSTMRKKFSIGRKGGRSRHAERALEQQIRPQDTGRKLVTKREVTAEAHSRWILILQGAQSCIVLCCFVSMGIEDESFEQESDITRCVFQEDNSAGRDEKHGKEKQFLQ